MSNSWRRPGWAAAVVVAMGLQAVSLVPARAQGTQPFLVRGRTLTLHLFGPVSGEVVVVASGDGGWYHLGPEVADTLARVGYRVVGFDSREYLSAFTSRQKTLREADVVGDLASLVAFAAGGHREKPILIGVSEGAGLCVLVAADAAVKQTVRGVVALGLPDLNELGWQWKDAMIYLTKGIPDEPMFSVARIIGGVAPLPLAAIHSTNDEFVPLPVIQRLLARAGEPKRLWVVRASNHRFSGNEDEFRRRLLEAVAWVKATAR